LVRGGKYFAAPTEVTVSGSTFGGCMLKTGWLGVGLRMEIHADGLFLVTTPVQELRVERMSSESKHVSGDQSLAATEGQPLNCYG
jgi:hypothetical protein